MTAAVWAAGVAAALVLAGCAQGVRVPEVVRVPVPVRCVDQVPARPALLSDAELLALDDYALPVSLARERHVLLAYVGELEAVVAGCVSR